MANGSGKNTTTMAAAFVVGAVVAAIVVYLIIPGSSAGIQTACAPGSTQASLNVVTPARAQTKAPFGGEEDVQFAKQLWSILQANCLVGPRAFVVTPHETNPPHGAWVSVIDGYVMVGGERMQFIVKNNYGGEGINEENVTNDPAKYLAAVTVMLRRKGYDPDNKDWYWAKYLPNGSLDKNPKGMLLAGRVAKGAKNAGCIACHLKAPGGDLVYLNDRFK